MITETDSAYDGLEHMDIRELLININREDQTVAYAVRQSIPQIETAARAIFQQMRKGGRLFYIGAGTSGRLGIVDASECPPTFGVPHDRVIGLIAGGDGAIRKAVEFAEDDPEQAPKDLLACQIKAADFLLGIAASGQTPYVVGGLRWARKAGIPTGCITCNTHSPVSREAEFPIEVVVGPEFVTGSTRMKAGTAQKLVLNMISTTVMIKLGHIRGNKMVDMQLANHKLVRRGINMIMAELDVDEQKAEALLKAYGSVRKAIDHYRASP